MKTTTFTRLLACVLCLCMVCGMAVTAFAAERETTSVIDTTLKGSVDIYKFDMTNAEKDGVWDSTYVSTGVYDQNVNDKLGGSVRAGDTDKVSDLGNGNTSNGYAVKGVEFTYLKVASIVTYTEVENGANKTMVLYGIDANEKGTDLLSALGLTKENRYVKADNIEGKDSNTIVYFESDVLINALRAQLQANATTVKNALEAYIKEHAGIAMDLTDENGYTGAKDLALGLYLFVETKVPEMVTNTTNPFFVSLPMTSVNGTNATDGGDRWIYDITLYPKNETSIATLEKTVRESMDDTGKNTATSVITDGFAHTATGSSGDIMEYQIISTLPSITSAATGLAAYNYTDELGAGLTYTKGDVKIEWFTDAACTQKIAEWVEGSGKFEVAYIPNQTNDATSTTMTITMTDVGLKEINTSAAVYTNASEVRRGYSDCTMRITYTAKIDSNTTAVFGDTGNENKVVLTWKRTSSEYFDTLVDDCHIYTYGIDLTKTFSDNAGDFSEVEFVLWNATDGYWVQAALNAGEGIYYVTDHLVEGGTSGHEDGAAHANLTAEEAAEAATATVFVPVTSAGTNGKVIIKGLEDDTYILTEINTDDGYTLLKDHIKIVISQTETTGYCDIYSDDVLGVIQNDPRYATIVNADNVDTVLGLKNMPQKQLAHHLLTASATIDGNAVTMLADDGSVNAIAPLSVVNTHGFDLPQTGETSATWMPLIGGSLIGLAVLTVFILLLIKRRDEEEESQNA